MQQVLIHQIFLKKLILANLKSDVDKLDIDKLKNLPSNLNNLKSKVDKSNSKPIQTLLYGNQTITLALTGSSLIQPSNT